MQRAARLTSAGVIITTVDNEGVHIKHQTSNIKHRHVPLA
jgi:hypothetical protein